MISLSLNHNSLRWILLVASSMMAIFIPIDFTILPVELRPEYLISRLGFQIPALLLLLGCSFHPGYIRYQPPAILCTILVVTYSNYWLIQQCWIKASFAFSYEGTLLYTFFAFFVVRINFRFGAAYVALSLVGFTALMTSYPIYGEYNFVNLGFVAMAQSICLVGLFTLTGSLKEVHTLAEKLRELSRVDQLSGLFNRRAYEQDGTVQFEQARRLQVPLAIFLLDIDNFKDYNDAYGHQQGDEVIKIQAEILTSVFRRQVDIIGRFGGEEFIVIANNVNYNNAERMAKLVIDGWAERRVPHGKGSGAAYVSCSIGIASLVPNDSITLTKLIGLADEALYQAKDNGRNRYETAPLQPIAA